MTISMEMSHHGFCKIFRIDFSLLYRYTHGAWKRKMHSFALIYIQGCKCRGGVKCLLECELMRGPLPWVLFCMCNVKVQTIQKISCNFREKIQNFAKCKYTGGQNQQKWHPIIYMNYSRLFQKVSKSRIYRISRLFI